MISNNQEMEKVINHTGKLLTNIALDLANTVEDKGVDICLPSIKNYMKRMNEIKYAYDRLMKVVNEYYTVEQLNNVNIVKVVNRPIIEECITKYINNMNVKVNIVPMGDKVWIVFTYNGDLKDDYLYESTYDYMKQIGLEGFCGGRIKTYKKLEAKYRDSHPMITVIVYEEMLKQWLIEILSLNLNMNESIEFIFDIGGY